MFTRRFHRHVPLAGALIAALCVGIAHAETADIHGQWVGRTQTENQRDADKTTLSLRAADEDSATLELDTDRTCKLRDGTYSAQGADAWMLRFKPTDGSGLCDRLSHGEIALRAAGPRKLAFEVRYPDGKGGEVRRSGVLARYP